MLDIGCVNHSASAAADPFWLHGCMRKSARYILGLDVDDRAIAELKSRGFNVECADATDFDIGMMFDVIVAGELVEHIIEHRGIFASVRRHLKPDGVLVITTPNALCLTYFVQNILYGHENENLDHTCLFTVTTLRAMLAKNGYDLAKMVFFPELEFERMWWPLRVFKYVQLSLALVRPSFCHS